MKPDVQYTRNGDVSLAYQVVGDGAHDLLVVSGFVSNLEYAWEYPSLSQVPLPARRDVSTDPHRSARLGPLGSFPGGADAGDDAPRPRDRAGRGGIGEGDALRDMGRLRHVHPLRGHVPRARRVAHPLHRLGGAETHRGLSVGLERRGVGRVAREHPGRMGHAGVGRQERAVDGSRDARSPRRTRSVDDLREGRREPVLRRGGDADVERDGHPRDPAVRPYAHAAPASRGRSDRAHRRGAVHGGEDAQRAARGAGRRRRDPVDRGRRRGGP